MEEQQGRGKNIVGYKDLNSAIKYEWPLKSYIIHHGERYNLSLLHPTADHFPALEEIIECQDSYRSHKELTKSLPLLADMEIRRTRLDLVRR